MTKGSHPVTDRRILNHTIAPFTPTIARVGKLIGNIFLLPRLVSDRTDIVGA